MFVGAPEAAEYSRSQLFSGQEIEVVARFSLAGGDPEASDTEKSPRGLGLQFRLPGGSRHSHHDASRADVLRNDAEDISSR
jgi:catalase